MSEIFASPYYLYFLNTATGIVGSLLIYSGILGTFINTMALARYFGLPTATEETIIMFPCSTGRNLGAGIFVWIMTLMGEKKTLGIFLLCWTWAGISDTKVLYDHPEGISKWMHIRNILILTVLGPMLIQYAAQSNA